MSANKAAPKPPAIDGIISDQDTVDVDRPENLVDLAFQGDTASSNRDPLAEMFGPDVIKKLIDAGVKQYLDTHGISATPAIAEDAPKVPTPEFTFLKHYRNDVSPEIEVQELNMDAEVPQMEPIPGSFLRFRRGHFFATTDNQVKQLDWMLNMAEHSADTSQVLGGNRAIYEDDGEKLYYCTAGCSKEDFVSASEAKYRAHMRGVHGVIL